MWDTGKLSESALQVLNLYLKRKNLNPIENALFSEYVYLSLFFCWSWTSGHGFFGDLSSDQANELLMNKHPGTWKALFKLKVEGTFLIRFSTQPGHYTIVMFQGSVPV